MVILAYDEKPGIQAIDNVSPDLPPVPGKHPAITRDLTNQQLALQAAIPNPVAAQKRLR